MTSDSQYTSLSDDKQEIVDSWIANAAATPHAKDVVRFARYVPELGWRAILAILELPGAESYLDDLAHPLAYIVVKFGDAFIDRIETEALVNPAFRRCLAKLPSDPKFRVPEMLWPRLSAAAHAPVGPIPPFNEQVFARFPNLLEFNHYDPNPLPPDDAPVLSDDQLREYARAWIVYRATVWAWDEFTVSAINDGWAAVWPMVVAIVEQGTDYVVATLGDAVLSDLIYDPEPGIIERVEAEAARSARFRYCLSFVERRRDSPEVWAVAVKARGDEPRRRLHPDVDDGPD